MDLTALMGALPVALTIATTQVVKAYDPQDKFKRWYFPVSIVIGVAIGAAFSNDLSSQNWIGVVQDGLQNCIISSFVITFKKPLGIKLPGDAK